MNGGDGDQKLGDDTVLPFTVGREPPIWTKGATGKAFTQNTESAVWVVMMRRMQATVVATLVLKAYPFDSQLLSVQIESSTYELADVRFVPTPKCARGFLPSNGIDGWKILTSNAKDVDHAYETFGENYSTVSMELHVNRLSEPLVQRYIWGVTFLVVMGILVLCVSADEPDRLGFVQSSFLGIVSWQFILVSSTPNLGYATRLDVFMIVAMGHVFAAYIWNALRAGFYKSITFMGQPVVEEEKGLLALKEVGGLEITNSSDGTLFQASRLPGPASPGTPSSPKPSKTLAQLSARTLKNLVTGEAIGKHGWGELNLHRKLDFAFILLLSISYAVFASWSLLTETQ